MGDRSFQAKRNDAAQPARNEKISVTLPSATPLIYLITDGSLTNENFQQESRTTLNLIEKAVAAGVHLVQIREKFLFTRLLLELVSRAVRKSAGSQTKILVNDRADVASAAGAHGVHLTERSMSADVIRKSFPEMEIVGVSAHTLDGVLTASQMKADFAVFGPVFSTPGKGSPIGIETLKETCYAAKPFPLILADEPL